MNGRVAFVGKAFKHEVEELRRQEYANASGFAVDLSTLGWRQSDSDSFVMAAFAGDRMIATMRGEVINRQALLEQKLECPWDFPMELRYPVLLLSRAATLTAERGRGLNLLLRHWFLRFAQHHELAAAVGTFVAGSPRERSLAAMGYELFENRLGWQQSTYRSLRPVAVAALDLRRDGARALNYCVEHASPGLAALPMQLPFPSLRFVESL